MTRAALIAKLREALHNPSKLTSLNKREIERIIDDLEFAEFAHKALEGGELPQTLKKQAI